MEVYAGEAPINVGTGRDITTAELTKMVKVMQSHPPAPRYLRYDEQTPIFTGMNHQLSNLECLMREAHATGRLAVLPALKLHPNHNFGVCNEWRWESYLDLGESRLVDAAGTERPLPVVKSLPDAVMRTLTLEPGARMPSARAHAPSTADYELVVRRIEHGLYREDVPADDRPHVSFRWRPSPRVLELARPVIVDLASRGGGRFIAVHVRRGDRLRRMQYLGRFAAPAHIRRRLKAQGVADGSVVFLLSDEWASDFWAPLKKHYELVRHTDYPRLAALVSPADGRRPDNYLLYEVEKEIMRSASMRIETFPRGQGRTDAHSALTPLSVYLVRAVYRRVRRWVRVMVR